MFVFLYSHIISAVLALSHYVACPGFMLIPHSVKGMGSWACTTSFYSLSGPGHCLGRSSYLSSPLGFHFCCSFSCHAYGLAMLAHWIYYLFLWAPKAHLLYFYFLLGLWTCWLSFLQCWTIGFITSFLKLPQPFTLLLPLPFPFFSHLPLLLGFFYH